MIKIVVDGTSDITQQEAKELGITVLPMKVNFGETEYIADVNLTNEEFYNKLEDSKVLPHTTQLNQDDFITVLKPILDEGNEVFVMSLSSELSGTYNSLRLAYEELNSDKIEIMDSETVTFAFAALVHEALEKIKKGISLKDLKQEMEQAKRKIKLVAIIDNVKYLVKGGRLSMVAGMLAGTLKIKPIVSIIDKKLKMISKAIGYSKAKNILAKFITNVDESKPIYFAHSNSPEKAEDLKKTLVENFGLKFEKSYTYGIGPVIGTHAGPNCVGLAYFEK